MAEQEFVDMKVLSIVADRALMATSQGVISKFTAACVTLCVTLVPVGEADFEDAELELTVSFDAAAELHVGQTIKVPVEERLERRLGVPAFALEDPDPYFSGPLIDKAERS